MGRSLLQKMKQLLDRQQYEVVLQAAVDGKVVARETLKAMRKDVTAKCYGGDITRKRKLLDAQKEGKKRMKQLGSISVPTSAFPELMKVR
jgi:translation elongation factor EF-4